MRFGFDSSVLRFSNSGVAHVARELRSALQAAETEHEIIDFHCPGTEPTPGESRLAQRHKVWKWQVSWPAKGIQHAVDELGLDLVHVPSTIAPRNLSVPLVITLHDIYPLVLPDAAKPWHRQRMKKKLPGVLRNAARVLTVSRFTRDELLNYYPWLESEKVVAVHNGMAEDLFPVPLEVRQPVLDRIGVRDPYLLVVASLEPRKNLSVLLEAFASIKDRIPHQLVMTGAPVFRHHELKQTIERLGITDRVLCTGFVDAADLPALYSGAEQFICPAIYEGFGLPLLEAMRYECPVLSSNQSSLPEVGGEAARYFDPFRPVDLAEQIRFLHQHPDERQALVIAGKERVRSFTWAKNAVQTLAIYHEVLA